jgi:transposase InsO family protein
MGRKKKRRGSETSADLRRRYGVQGSPYPLELRVRAARSVVEDGMPMARVAQALGIPYTTVSLWVQKYRQGGVEGLTPQPKRATPRKRASDDTKRRAVIELRQEHPEYGTRRIRDLLARFSALGVSETEVRRVLHEAGLIEPAPATGSREHPERRFERAEPNQLWQSDIFTFLLRRYERIYLAAFMDDHSRFLVSWAVAHHQRSSLVMEALRKGIAAFGTPTEILTDQGRQYTAWRGSTEFEEELRRENIRHIKSRPQHPQTLGKIERFWKTLWDEFLSRTVFSDFADLQRRLGLFVDAYNFQRPHQALAGLVPADRFFRAAPQVRAAIEKNVAENALRLAQEQPARKPFYLVGRLGDQDLTIAAAGRGLRVQMGDGEPKTIELEREVDDAENQVSAGRVCGGTSEEEASTEGAAGAEVGEAESGPRRNGAQAVLDDLERALGSAAGVGRDRGGADIAGPVLPARDEGDARDARSADAVDGFRGRARDIDDGARDAARSEGDAPRAREAAARAPALRDEANREARPGGAADGAWEEAFDIELDEEWQAAFASLTDDDGLEPAEPGLGPDGGWRGRALRWERKLAGESAKVEAREHGKEAQERLRAEAADDRRGHAAICDGAVANRGRPDGGGSSGEARHLAREISDAQTSGDGRFHRSTETEATGPTSDAGEAGRARRGERAAAEGERTPEAAGGDDRANPQHDERGLAREGEATRATTPVEADDSERGGFE